MAFPFPQDSERVHSRPIGCPSKYIMLSRIVKRYNFIVDEIVPSWSIQQEKIYQKPFLVAARDGFLFLRKPVKQEGFSSDSLEGTQV